MPRAKVKKGETCEGDCQSPTGICVKAHPETKILPPCPAVHQHFTGTISGTWMDVRDGNKHVSLGNSYQCQTMNCRRGFLLSLADCEALIVSTELLQHLHQHFANTIAICWLDVDQPERVVCGTGRCREGYLLTAAQLGDALGNVILTLPEAEAGTSDGWSE